MDDVARILDEQDGVITRNQLLGAAQKPHDLERMLRRRQLAPVHPRVYVNHTGPMTWQQRAWAAVLYAAPSALTHESAVRAGEGPGRREREDGPIHVAIAEPRRLITPPGIRVHRMRGFEDRVQWNLGPPRVRYEEALLDLADAAASEIEAIARLADACGARRTTGRRLLERAEGRPRMARRQLLTAVLGDVAAGTCSALEQAYLDRVVRPHGLPEGERQASHRHAGTTAYRDVDHPGLGLVVELDGRLFHESVRDRDLNMDRDLAAAVDGRETLRLSWGQCVERACTTADRVGAVMRRHGWAGALTLLPRLRRGSVTGAVRLGPLHLGQVRGQCRRSRCRNISSSF